MNIVPQGSPVVRRPIARRSVSIVEQRCRSTFRCVHGRPACRRRRAVRPAPPIPRGLARGSTDSVRHVCSAREWARGTTPNSALAPGDCVCRVVHSEGPRLGFQRPGHRRCRCFRYCGRSSSLRPCAPGRTAPERLTANLCPPHARGSRRPRLALWHLCGHGPDLCSSCSGHPMMAIKTIRRTIEAARYPM